MKNVKAKHRDSQKKLSSQKVHGVSPTAGKESIVERFMKRQVLSRECCMLDLLFRQILLCSLDRLSSDSAELAYSILKRRAQWSSGSTHSFIQSFNCKCMPILLYGLECFSVAKHDVRSLNFAVTRFLMKLFRSSNINVIDECRLFFNFMLSSEKIEKRRIGFESKFSNCTSLLYNFNICQ